MIRVEVAFSGQKELFRFEKPQISVGRVRDNDLVLPHSSVAEHHAAIVGSGSVAFTLVGPDRGLPMTVNDRPFQNGMLVYDGDVVKVGAYALTLLERDPVAGREAELLRMLETNPADDDARAVYSDWLEEHGRANEAEFLRLQLSLAALALDTEGADFLVRSSRLRGLGRSLPVSWRRVVARPPIEKCSVRFELQCPKQWSALTPTATPSKRFCNTCNEHVHYAPTLAIAREFALTGACVAVDLNEHRSPDDLDPPTRAPMLGGVIAPPSWHD